MAVLSTYIAVYRSHDGTESYEELAAYSQEQAVFLAEEYCSNGYELLSVEQVVRFAAGHL